MRAGTRGLMSRTPAFMNLSDYYSLLFSASQAAFVCISLPSGHCGTYISICQRTQGCCVHWKWCETPPLSLLSSRPHCLCFWVVSTPVIILLPRGTWGGLPACLRGAGRQRHLGTRAGAGGHGSRQAAGFGNPAGGTSRGQGCQKQTALRHCLA